MPIRVVYSPRAQKQILALPIKLKTMVEGKARRLSDWPEVPGVAALHGGEAGLLRIHAGDYRIIFKLEGGAIMVEEVTDRKEVYSKKGKRSRRDEDVLVSVPRSSLRGGRNYVSDLLRWAIARDLKAARLAGGFTQVELARRIRRTQAAVSGAESGRIRVGLAYVAAVLRACGLPSDWRPPMSTYGAKGC